MIQFTEQEILHLQERGRKQPKVMERLKDAVKEV